MVCSEERWSEIQWSFDVVTSVREAYDEYLLLSEASNIHSQSSSAQFHIRSLQRVFLVATIVLFCVSVYTSIVISLYDIEKFSYSV